MGQPMVQPVMQPMVQMQTIPQSMPQMIPQSMPQMMMRRSPPTYNVTMQPQPTVLPASTMLPTSTYLPQTSPSTTVIGAGYAAPVLTARTAYQPTVTAPAVHTHAHATRASPLGSAPPVTTIPPVKQ